MNKAYQGVQAEQICKMVSDDDDGVDDFDDYDNNNNNIIIKINVG